MIYLYHSKYNPAHESTFFDVYGRYIDCEDVDFSEVDHFGSVKPVVPPDGTPKCHLAADLYLE